MSATASQVDGAAPTIADDTGADFGSITMLANGLLGIIIPVVLHASMAAGVTPGCGLADC